MCVRPQVTGCLPSCTGMPPRTAVAGRVPSLTISPCCRAVAQLAADVAAVMPEGMKTSLHRHQQAAPSCSNAWPSGSTSRSAKACLAATMTTDDGSSQSQANVHNEVRMDILRADAKQLAATLNRDLVRTFIDLNFGPQVSVTCASSCR
ncbi:phage portal protein family protein [Ectopseudomonas oleovorans]|uniref:phage portal protein family protein n=1 Tax=Ectopseudomonas oleovorans TaxID=301 RepID=UPI003F1B6163